MSFDFKKNLIKVQGGRTYLPVSARVVWFREVHPDWGVVTEPLEINHEKQYAVFRATIFNADGKIMATATKKEDVKGFGDYLEKSETGAVGRALAFCGFGTQFSPELDEVGGGRLADSPQPMGGGRPGGGSYGGGSNFGGNRYGNGGSGGSYGGNGPAPGGSSGNRFTPPREEGAPRQETAPVRNAAPSPAPRPAPAPVASDEDEDDFEALIGSDAPVNANDDDPFGGEEEAPARPVPAKAPTASAAAPSAEAKPDGPPACIGCGKALTKAQNDLSIRNFGEALCPTCQRDKPRTERPVAAAR